jgi:anti-sigma factor RsiW
MSEDEPAISEREQIEMLLPWYVRGTLAADDRGRVERYLADHPELRQQLDLIREEQHETVAANEALPTPPAGALERLTASLPQRRAGLLERLRQRESWGAIAEFFSAPTPSGVRIAAMAAALLLLVQSLAIGALLVRSDGAAYETAAGRTGHQAISVFVGFTDEASAGAISALLRELDARIVDGPKPGAIYQIKVQTNDPSAAAAEALERRLLARRELVRVVLSAKE